MLISLDIERVEPLADGAPFGESGAYERVIGKARGEVDPEHPGNRGIALIDKVPRNANGRVEYTADVFILRPRDPAKGNGRILYEVNNRGRKMLFGNIADGPQGVNDPKTVADVGNGFPLRRGYTIVWSGWDPDAPRANMGLGLTAPVATDNGEPIVEMVRDEFVSGTRVGNLEAFKLAYEAATPGAASRTTDGARARADEPRELPLNEWSFVDSRSIKLRDGAKPKPGYLYEFHYEARNPKVQALGFAATRDVVSWLRRYDPAAVAGHRRPISHALAMSTRAIRTIPCRPCAPCWWRSTNGSCRARSHRPAGYRRSAPAPWSNADKTGFPAVPGAAVVKVTNRVAPPGDWVNPRPADKAYRTLVCKVDADGNEAAGIRLPDIAVPLATYSGWNEYKPPTPRASWPIATEAACPSQRTRRHNRRPAIRGPRSPNAMPAARIMSPRCRPWSRPSPRTVCCWPRMPANISSGRAANRALRRRGENMAKLDRDGVRIHYEVHGSGPTLLLSHGYSSTARMWTARSPP